MNKTMKFIMSKNFLPVLLILVVAGIFATYKTMGGDGNTDNIKLKNEKILHNVGLVLKEGHYSPRKIDDAFSLLVFNKYLNDIDPDKMYFLAKDITSFKKYQSRIDDEINGRSPLESFYTISNIYNTRVGEVAAIYQKFLKAPFNFNVNDSINTDGEKRQFSKTAKDREEYARLRVKYLVLSKFVDLQEERIAGAGKPDFKYKADSTLEREAREKVGKQLTRYFTNLKVHNTPENMFSDFVNAVTETMDPHTAYFAPIDKRSFNEMISGSFYGIGAQLREDADGKIKVASVIPNMPAWKSKKINVDDEVIKIAQGNAEPVDVTGYSVTDAVKLIRGAEKNSEVRLTIKKVDGSIIVVSLLRDKIPLEETYAKSALINGAHKVGYIYLPEFYANFDDPNGRRCATDVAKEIEKLKGENVEGIIMDLRNNGGGSLNDVVEMAGLFIEDGPICQVKGRDERTSILRDRNRNILYSGPLVVMVDELSASASEIFAAAIQDYKRGVIVGSSTTYGKGTVQRSISLDPESENPFFQNNPKEGLGDIKLTFRKFYRINGGSTQLRGVTPDIIFPDRLEIAKIREKDNPSALSWDEISKADYRIWDGGYNMNSIVTNTNNKLKSNSTFNLIRQDVQWLDNNLNKSYSLNLNKYKLQQKQVRYISKQLDSIAKVPEPLKVLNLAVDESRMGSDTDRIERNKTWLKRIGEDYYIDQTVKIVYDMIGEGLAAARNKK
ncbi:carboxy terminal-processing peptidase [soil metagenome]